MKNEHTHPNSAEVPPDENSRPEDPVQGTSGEQDAGTENEESKSAAKVSRWRAAREYIFGRLDPWIGLLSGVVGLIAVVWTIIRFIVARGEFDLVVWIQDDIPVYPADSTDALPLPFVFAGELTESATIVPVSITNFGSGAIGNQNDLWQLNFDVDDNQGKTVLLGAPDPTSDRTVVNASNSPSSDTVSLEIGILESGEQIDLKLLVVNAENPRQPELDVTTSLRGLPQPFVTGQSLYGRLLEKFFTPAALAVAVIFSIAVFFELRAEWSSLTQKPIELPSPFRAAGAILGRFALVAIVAFFYGLVISLVLGGLAWLVLTLGR